MKIKLHLPNRRFHQLGLSLIEMLVVTAIIGVMFVSLYAGITSGFGVVNLARENLRATQIVLEKMETIRLYTWDQINSNGFVPLTFTAPFFPPITNNNQIEFVDEVDRMYANATRGSFIYYGKVVITNAPVSPGYSNRMKLVRVSVYWTNGNVGRVREMETYVSEYGIQNYIY